MGAVLSAARKEVYPGVVPVEQMPRDVDVGSGQGYVVRAGTTPSTDVFGGLLWFIQASSVVFLFQISLNSSSVRTAGQGWKRIFILLLAPVSVYQHLGKNIHRGVEVNYSQNYSNQ